MKSKLLFLLLLTALFACYQKRAIKSILISPEKIKLFCNGEICQNNAIQKYVLKGVIQVESFFNHKFQNEFEVKIFSERKYLDDYWRKRWKMPEFSSECWMVASGDTHEIAILDTTSWKTQACEHDALDKLHVQNLITHELVHVFHEQFKKTKFSSAEGINWLIEGLATYCSGQLTQKKFDELCTLVKSRTAVDSLKNAHSGKHRYTISGTFVEYIDNMFGRKKIFELLKVSDEKSVLQVLNKTESSFIEDWSSFVENQYCESPN